MNRRKYDRLDYVGNARYIVIDIYPHKSEVKISANNPYVFDENDVLNQTAIDYYKSLYDYGVRLHEVDSADKKDETPVNTSTDNNSEVDNTDDKDPLDENPTDESSTNSDDESVKKDQDDEDPAEVNSTEVDSADKKDETPVNTEATAEEMAEFLDLTYDDESIKTVARESGINRIMSAWDKQEIISKIIENNSQYVINLMKNQ